MVAVAAALAVTAVTQTNAQSPDLSVVNQDSNWAAGCGTDTFGIDYCAVQKSNGSRALGYVLERRQGGVDREVRISIDSILIDTVSPVTIQIDDNEPMVWTTGYEVINGNVISVSGESIEPLLRELSTGASVIVTVFQKTGEPISFELPLDGFSQAIEALERTAGSE
ncbi:MAG: invasion associated locus B family protein [Alphaproteobacteria bacterium]